MSLACVVIKVKEVNLSDCTYIVHMCPPHLLCDVKEVLYFGCEATVVSSGEYNNYHVIFLE